MRHCLNYSSTRILSTKSWNYPISWWITVLKVLQLSLTLSLPEYLMEFCKVTLTFESVDKLLWCDHSNERSLPVLTHDTICFSKFHKVKLVKICFLLNLAVKELNLTSITAACVQNHCTYCLSSFILILWPQKWWGLR